MFFIYFGEVTHHYCYPLSRAILLSRQDFHTWTRYKRQLRVAMTTSFTLTRTNCILIRERDLNVSRRGTTGVDRRMTLLAARNYVHGRSENSPQYENPIVAAIILIIIIIIILLLRLYCHYSYYYEYSYYC
jgi:hypothetical protein